jgi:hypothetical protein
LTRTLELLAPEQNAAESIYGTILIAALLAAESGLHDSYTDAIASAAIAAALAWLARAYADLLGRRLERGERLTAAALVHALREDSAIVRGATVPLVVLVLAWALGATQQTGVTAALYSSIASLIALELLAGVRAGANARELALEAVVGATIGSAILALKVILH